MTTPSRGHHFPTLYHLLRWRAEHEPDKPAYHFLRDGLTVSESLTYGALDRAARALAACLQARFQIGDRVLLLYPPGVDFVKAFWGTLYAGMVAVPAPAVDRMRLQLSTRRIQTIVHDAQAAGILSTTDALTFKDSPSVAVSGLASLPWIATDVQAQPAVACDWLESVCEETHLAYLQYTSGSTASPKGVMVSHANVTQQCRYITHAGRFREESATLSWMPHFHDYGLVKGIVHPVSQGIPSYLMSPLAFLKQPIRWLQSIDQYGISHTGGPNFAYCHCVQTTTEEERRALNLKGWQVASCGAEPIFPDTIMAFTQAFRCAGFRPEAFTPAYGMAEFTLLISVKPPDVPPKVYYVNGEELACGVVRPAASTEPQRGIVSCGRPVGETKVLIVDPESRTQYGSGRVGEIWLSDRSVAIGYWNRPDETSTTFQASLADSGEGPFLRTGDLGFMHEGELYVTGRLKDLIIIRGRNHYPQDIERAVETCSPKLRIGCGAAFSVDEDQEERLVVVQEADRQVSVEDVEPIAEAIRKAVSEQFDIHLYTLVLIKAGSIPKTSSGKIQRRACKEAYRSGQLREVGSSVVRVPSTAEPSPAGLSPEQIAWLPTDARRREIETLLTNVLAGLLHRPQDVVMEAPSLNALGLDSMKAAVLIHRLEAVTGSALPLELAVGNVSCDQLVDHLMVALEHKPTAVSDLVPQAVAEEGEHPLSANQAAVWFLHQLDPEHVAGNVALIAYSRAGLTAEGLEASLVSLVQRHAALRTTYHLRHEQPVQLVHAALPLDFVTINARGWTWEAIRARALADVERPFDLGRGPVWRARWFQREGDSFLVLCAHHIAVDGWSMTILLRDLALLCEESGRGLPTGLKSAAACYSSYVHWQRDMLAGPEGERLRSYWVDQLSGDIPVLKLASCGSSSMRNLRQAGRHSFVLDRGLSDALAESARATGTTLYTVLLAAFQVLLARYSGERDIWIGSPTFGRTRAEFAETVGDFINIVVLRAAIDEDAPFQLILSATQQTVLKALAHREYPFSRLVEEIAPLREIGQSPLVQVLFVLQDFQMLQELDALQSGAGPVHAQSEESSNRMFEPYVIPQPPGQFELTLEMAKSERGLSGYFEYQGHLFDAATIEHMQRHFAHLLQSIVKMPHGAVNCLSMMTEDERSTVLVKWNGVSKAQPEPRCLHELVESQARLKPDAVALVHGSVQMTYSDLDQHANRLARHLQRQGVSRDVVVGLYCERSVEAIVGLLAILKAGGAYLPLDPSYPRKRLDFMLREADVALLLTQERLLSEAPTHTAHTICLDAEWDLIVHDPDPGFSSEVTESNLAYVVFTSGSTGDPKGVMVEHRSVVNYARALAAEVRIRPDDRVLQFASLSFDTAAEEIFLALCSGATLVLRPDTMLDSVPGFLATCDRLAVTVVDLPTAYWHDLLSQVAWQGTTWPACVHTVIIGGERAHTHALAAWHRLLGSKVRLLNTYGPTEVTIAATIGDLSDPECNRGWVTIGRPLPNVQIYVLDRNLQPVPVGCVGEIHVGGLGLARGYVRRTDLTAARFIADPFNKNPHAKLYRTGDLARWQADGRLEFMGRGDRQVKIRGHRIELEELERVLYAHPDVQEAAVEAREDQEGDPRLVAFVVARPGGALTTESLRNALRHRVPGYMIPSTFVEMERLPLTPNGKLDHRALHTSADSRSSRLHVKSSYWPPRSPTEQVLADMWAEILHIKDVGIHDNFFELGGHSLLATQLFSRIRSLYGVELPLRLVFETPTIANLAAHVERARPSSTVPVPSIRRLPRDRQQEPLELSFAQERMWFLYQLSPQSAAYNIPASIRLHGPLNRTAFRFSVHELVQRHESLRTTFDQPGQTPVQVVHAWIEPGWVEKDLRNLDRHAREEVARDEATAEARRPFDLQSGPLLRVLLLQLADEEHVLVFTTHHIIADQWSYGIIARELVGTYNAVCNGQPSISDTEPGIQYVDFAHWQRAWLTGPALERQLSFWKKHLQGLPHLTLPSDYPRSGQHSFAGDHVSIDLPWTLINRLTQLSVREGVTLYMVCLAAFATLLHRLSGPEDFPVATPIANRNRVDVEGLIGTFVNTLVLRMDLSGEPSFQSLLRRVRDLTLQAYAHQDIPFEKLVEELHPDRSHGGLPLAQVLFNFANTPFARTDFKHLAWAPYEISRGAAQFDLSLSVDPLASRKAYLEFNTELFEKASMERWLGHYRMLLEAAADMPDALISRMPMMTMPERNRLTVEWQGTQVSHEGERTVVQAFQRQARLKPDSVAVSCKHQSLTYGELDRRSNQLARHLRCLGVRSETLVAVYLERSLDLLVSLLGTMKAGGAYLPLVPGLPTQRILRMLESSGASVLVTRNSHAATLPHRSIHMVDLDTERNVIEQESPGDLSLVLEPHHLAYVLYTSGSTGQPKGVEIEHRALMNFLYSMQQQPGLDATDVMLAVTPISFDIAGLELYLPLIVGGRVELANREQALDGNWLRQQLDAGRITMMQATPATWRLVVHAGWKGKRPIKVLCGGEALSQDLALDLHKRAGSVWNLYGPTETTIWSTLDRVDDISRISIGRPIANTRVYVLDEKLEPVPAGVPGELYIGGEGVARGYRGAPALTQERFIESPFVPRERLYRTGDQVQWLPDGRLEYIGRKDYQIKIRGFRIELGEIESVVARHPLVKQAVVLAREDSPGDPRLVAYAVPREEEVNRDLLRRFAQEQLPDYMVPSAFVFLQSFPLTPNGKVDRSALPPPASDLGETERMRIQPRNRVELQLMAIWEQVLGVAGISIRDNFFELGGHSLLAVRMFTAIEQTFAKRLPLAVLFEAPTIEQLATVLSVEGASVRWNSLVAIQPEGKKLPIFAVPGVGGNVLVFARLSRLLGSDRPVYGLQARGLDGQETPFTVVEEMAAHYIREMRSVQPVGPYVVAGTCTGGVVTYEMAQQLLAQGEQVVLAIMESWHPQSYQARRRLIPYTLWPVLFLLQKVTAYVRESRALPVTSWPRYWSGKLSTLWSRMHHSGNGDEGHVLSESDRVTFATFLAVSRYHPKPYAGRLLNVIASKRALTSAVEDTRLCWSGMAGQGSQTVYIPAEDSGRLFVAPHVNELANVLTTFFDGELRAMRKVA